MTWKKESERHSLASRGIESIQKSYNEYEKHRQQKIFHKEQYDSEKSAFENSSFMLKLDVAEAIAKDIDGQQYLAKVPELDNMHLSYVEWEASKRMFSGVNTSQEYQYKKTEQIRQLILPHIKNFKNQLEKKTGLKLHFNTYCIPSGDELNEPIEKSLRGLLRDSYSYKVEVSRNNKIKGFRSLFTVYNKEYEIYTHYNISYKPIEGLKIYQDEGRHATMNLSPKRVVALAKKLAKGGRI